MGAGQGVLTPDSAGLGRCVITCGRGQPRSVTGESTWGPDFTLDSGRSREQRVSTTLSPQREVWAPPSGSAVTPSVRLSPPGKPLDVLMSRPRDRKCGVTGGGEGVDGEEWEPLRPRLRARQKVAEEPMLVRSRARAAAAAPAHRSPGRTFRGKGGETKGAQSRRSTCGKATKRMSQLSNKSAREKSFRQNQTSRQTEKSRTHSTKPRILRFV